MDDKPTDNNPKVFYSWQSNLNAKTNRYIIRDCIKKICKENNLTYDEGTKDRCGSPDIARSIEEKIKSADIFIADVTIVNADQQANHTPNPNVLFELGIAQAILGWERIILIVNTAYAPIDKLPFDINKHRAMSYTLSPQDIQGSDYKQQIKNLQDSLETGILSIIKDNPLKEILKGEQTERKQHDRDSRKLKKILSHINIDQLFRFGEDGPKYVPDAITDMKEILQNVINDISFIFYDKQIEDTLKHITGILQQSFPIQAPYNYDRENKRLIWKIPFDVFMSPEDEKLFHKAASACLELKKWLKEFVKLVHEKYIEIDLEETNAMAAKFISS